MTRVSLLSSPFLLGFDRLESMLERAARSADDAYPPYNIEQTSETSWRIVLAVAGFLPEHLSATVEDNQLVVAGAQPEDKTRNFVHRGIATRQFQRRFILAEGIEVVRAGVENGLLTIELTRPKTQSVVRRIDIVTR
ncbi:Hsp20 family protein [Iodidimonas sp. SYSU 1G8]|uniref:Hsp20 family protein n=1 Tax=Iodidimonas sp. SYSU 1G8 TaxID=3133967 RepID=UPI0031FE7370